MVGLENVSKEVGRREILGHFFFLIFEFETHFSLIKI